MRPPAHLIRSQCVIVHRSQNGPRDDFGQPTWLETETEALCAVFPVGSDEVADRPAGRFTHRAFLLPGTLVFSNDSLVMADGRSWEVDGPARMWQHPRTLENVYQEVDLVGYSDDELDLGDDS